MPSPQHRKRKRPVVHNPPRKNAASRSAGTSGAAARLPEAPPVTADVWRWFRTGVLDAFIFLIGAFISSVIQLRTGFQWMIFVGVIIAVILTNMRRLPTRPKAVKAGYFGGLASLFTVGMIAMLFIMPRDAWSSVLLFAAGMLVVSVSAIVIGLRAVAPTAPAEKTSSGEPDARS